MNLHLVCHHCYAQQRLSSSPQQRVLVCGLCRCACESPFVPHRILEVPPCAGCGLSYGLRNLTRHGAVLRYPRGLADCPACGQTQMEIVQEALVTYDPSPERRLGERIHCRMVDTQRAVMLGQRPFPVQGGASGWGEAEITQLSPFRARWVRRLYPMPGLSKLQLDVGGVPWLQLSLDGLKSTWPAWEQLVEPLLETLLPLEIEALGSSLRADLSVSEQLSWLTELEAWGGEVLQPQALFDLEQGQWVSWQECEILVYRGRAGVRELRGQWPAQPRGGGTWTAVEWRAAGRRLGGLDLSNAVGEDKKPPLERWHERGIEAAWSRAWPAAHYWLWRGAREDHLPSLLALVGLHCGALDHPVEPELGRHYLFWALNHDEVFQVWLDDLSAGDFKTVVAEVEHRGAFRV